MMPSTTMTETSPNIMPMATKSQSTNHNTNTITPTLEPQRHALNMQDSLSKTQNQLQEDVITVARDQDTAEAFSHHLFNKGKQVDDESAPIRVNVNIRVRHL